ncbi:RHS repeat-associated core domain-containing protein [candidate division WOR-3 bacterium]|nr:RHS repeat-associated core domain-containing protein [candidate division WOR-3 bacterium]
MSLRQYSIAGASNNNYRFTGKEYDQSTGLYYFGARYYMPEIGRFITPDPIMGTGSLNLREPISLNFYPLRYIDPHGKEEKEARDFGRTNLLKIIYGNDYNTFTNVVCDRFVSYAYRGAGHSDFPMSGEKYQGKWSNWFANMQNWFQQPGREFIALGDIGKYTPEEGDVIFFQQLSNDGKPIPGKYHVIMISEAKSEMVRIMGARGKGMASGETGLKSFTNITANNWYGEFIGIGRVIPKDKERITEENR